MNRHEDGGAVAQPGHASAPARATVVAAAGAQTGAPAAGAHSGADAVAHVEAVAGTSSPGTFAATVAQFYARSGPGLRMLLLKALLPAVRPLALTVIAAGAFARYLGRARWEDVPVSLEDAAGFSAAQVMDLALYVEQSHPGWVAQATSALSQGPATLHAAGAALVALAVGRFIDRRGAPQEPVEAD